MSSKPLVSRRSVLAAGAAGVAGAAGAAMALAGGGALLGGCGTDGGCHDWSAKDRPRPLPTAGPAVLAVLADIEVGHAVTARTPRGEPVLVARTGDRAVTAFDARCPHRGCLVAPDGTRLRCPPHDGRFDLATGSPTGGPPKRALPRVEVAIRDGLVVLAG